jgi:transcriptional regulator with XRE-family HTH domain
LEEENLVKKTCKELGITQKQLAEMMGVTPHTVTDWSRGNLTKIHKFALNGLISEQKYLKLRKILTNVAQNTF